MSDGESVGVAQHWKGNWQPYEGTRAFAAEVGFRAIAMESEDALSGPPPRKDLRRAYFERDVRMAGTGPLMSWADGRRFKAIDLEEADHTIHNLFLAFCNQECSDAEIEKTLCDVFMGLRMGGPDRVHDFLQLLHTRPTTPWFASVRRAVQFEVMQPCFPSRPQNGRTFWATGLLQEFAQSLEPIETDHLRWNGFIQDTPLRFGQLLLWSRGACGQTFRSQILNDWTHLVLEQGVTSTLSRTDHLHRNGRSCARWLVDAFVWRTRIAIGKKFPRWSSDQCLSVGLRNPCERRAPELGDAGWQITARHWNWIVEWVLAWRADIQSDRMLSRAEALAHHLLEADGAHHNPFSEAQVEATVPPNPLDLDNRLTHTFRYCYREDWRLTDEIYPAIFTAVAGWLRGAGRANSSASVIAAAPWLQQLIPARRYRMSVALKGLKVARAQLGGQSDDVFLANWPKGCAEAMGLSPAEFERWCDCQATPHEELLEAVAYALHEGEQLESSLCDPLPTRLKALTGIRGQGTGKGRGIDLDLLWGIEALLLYLQNLPLSNSNSARETEAIRI